MKITDSIAYVGVNDHEIDLFEGQYDVPPGMAYNSYVIMDEKIAVMDSVDKNYGEKWLTNIRRCSTARRPITSSCSIWSPTTRRTSRASWIRSPTRRWSRRPRRST